MTGYIENRKRLVDARVAALAMGRESGFAKAHADVVSFDEACQPQVDALVEAVAEWRAARLAFNRTDSIEEFRAMGIALEAADDASAALDARADEVAGKESDRG